MQITDQNEARAKRVFAAFRVMFGSQKLTLMYGDQNPDDVLSVWSAALTRYSDRQIRAALNRVAQSGSAFIPSLPEFCVMCRDAIAPEHVPYKALPAPDYPREKAQQNLARIRQLLAGAVKELR